MILLTIALAVAPPAASANEPETVTRQVVADFAKCAVRSKPGEAEQMVLSEDAARRPAGGDPLFDGKCLDRGAQLRADRWQMRYALADALLQARPTMLAADVAAASALEHRPFVDRPMPAEVAADAERRARWETFARRGAGYATLSQFGECVVRKAPAQSRALLATKVESAEEGRAIAALTPLLGDCVKTSTQLELSKYNLRGTIALNYYRLAKAPRAEVAR